MNKVILIGRLTKDPELRYTQGGTAVCNFTLAVDRPFSNQDGKREADFIEIVVWRKAAENVAKYMQKGRQIAVDGRIQVRSYDDKDGKRQWRTEVIAESVEFLGSAGGGNRSDAGGFAPARPETAPQRNDFSGYGEEVVFQDEDDELPF